MASKVDHYGANSQAALLSLLAVTKESQKCLKTRATPTLRRSAGNTGTS